MKLSKAVFLLIVVFVFLVLACGLIGNCYVRKPFLRYSIIICLANFLISLSYLFIHAYFYKKKPYAFGFIAMITLTIKFVMAYLQVKLMGNVIYEQLFLKVTYFIVFAIFMIADVVYSAILLNSTKK